MKKKQTVSMSDKLMKKDLEHIKQALDLLSAGVDKKFGEVATTLKATQDSITSLSSAMTLQSRDTSDLKARLDRIEKEAEKEADRMADALKELERTDDSFQTFIDQVKGSLSGLKILGTILAIVNAAIAIFVFVRN